MLRGVYPESHRRTQHDVQVICSIATQSDAGEGELEAHEGDRRIQAEALTSHASVAGFLLDQSSLLCDLLHCPVLFAYFSD